MASTVPRVAAGVAGAGGVGVLLHSWFGGSEAQPANLSHNHTHHHDHYALNNNVKPTDLVHEAPRTVDNSKFGLVESWVGPAEPVNTKHHFEQPHPNLKTKLDIGVESRPSNSVFGLLNNWFGPGAPATQSK